MSFTAESPADFRVGQRVQIHPGTDRWMRGDRFGEVVAIGRKWVKVKFDRSGDLVQVAPGLLQPA